MLNNVIMVFNSKFKRIFMRNIIITSVAAVAVLAFAGCAPKTACPGTEKVVVAPTPAPVAIPAPVVAAPAPVVQVVEPVAVPVIDAKEAAVQ